MYKIKLSPYAKIFYNEWLLAPQSNFYNIVMDQMLFGNLDVNRLRKALKRYVAEHVLLNSHIQCANEKVCWVKNASIRELEYSNLTATDGTVNTIELYNYVTKAFDLHQDQLYRFKLLCVKKNVYRFILVFHHILLDGLSTDFGIFETISNYYNNENHVIKYSIDEQVKMIASLSDILSVRLEQNKDKHKEFWHKQLAAVEGVDLRFLKLNVNNDKKVSEKNRNSIEEIRFSYGEIELAKLNQIKRKYVITPYSYGQCIFALLLHKYTGQKNLAISYPIAIKEGIDFIYGAQVNTNLISYKFTQNTTIVELFNQSREFFNSLKQDGINHGYYPIINIIQEGSKDLLNLRFIQANFKDKIFEFEGITKVEIADEFNIDAVDPFLFEQELRDNKINYRIKYDKNIINEELIKGFVNAYKKLFLEVLDDLVTEKSDKLLSDYSLLDQQQYHRIIHQFNQTEENYPHDKTIHALFEEQVLKTPNNIAVIYENIQLTYQDLNDKANQLANYLRFHYDIKPDDLVVLCLDRSEQMLIAILGVLKSGGAYVPLDPKFPDERINYILSNTKAGVILTNDVYQSKLRQISNQNDKNPVVSIDNKTVQVELMQQKTINPNTSTISSNLVYVLYTSGTTGNPKGVMLEHVTCVNRILEMISKSHISGSERVLFKTNYIFDVSFSDIFTALLVGASLIVAKDVFDVEEIATKLINQEVDVCHFTPSQFEAIRGIKGVKLFEKLKILNFSGEALYPKLLSGINKNVSCINYYGPTETGEVTYENIKLTKSNGNVVTIGRALHNVKLFILDEYLMPLPIGAVGELYISGACLARGYLNYPQLTDARFIINTLQTEQEKQQGVNSRIYKTGDLVRWLPNGNIEYIGRNDAQVKVRGYRIELGEIENQLLAFDGVKQAVATISEQIGDSGNLTIDKHLVAYYVADRKLDEEVLYDYLLSRIPEYMVPNAVMRLDELPLTSNGKLDIAALPKILLTNNYIAPNNQLQKAIVAIWSEILQLPKNKIGITESFFRLGGTSLSLIRLQLKLSKIPELKNIKIADLFKYTTIEQLTEFIGCGGADKIVEVIEYETNKKTGVDNNIAVIAMSGAFSGCKNISEYWDLIHTGKEGLKTATIENCSHFGISEEVLKNPNFLPRSGHVSDTDKFDVKFWNITPNEAKNMDPQIRKFLEHSWYLLETSGYASLRHKINIGVFAGGGDSVYIPHFVRQPLIVSGIGNLSIKDALATHVAYLLGLIGPANNINTACSTSLVAIVEACKSLSGKYCDMAIAGGSALLLPEEVGYVYQEGMIFSQDGHCRTFDHKASGTVPGSGIGAVLLKRLADAKKDGDNIIAVINGYVTNNDGNRKISYTAPSIIGQKECIINAQKMAGITSDKIDYIECHGTGTKLGDPIEIQALNEAFKYNANKNNMQPHKCIIGAVKANIGHSGAAAGVAGLIKVCQMLQHNTIPKQINYNAPNATLHLEDTNFEIITKAKKWDKINNTPRIAGVSAFGIGGTNAHVIISEYIPDIKIGESQVCAVTQKQLGNYILPLSAKTPASLEAYKRDFIDYLTNVTDDIRNIAYTLQLKREYFACRLSIVADSAKDAISKLRVAESIDRINIQKKHNVIFMFPGQGNQYANMSLDLYQGDSDYKNIVDECIKLVNKYTNVQFEKILFPALFDNEISNYDINQTELAQPALFTIEYSLAKWLETLNINAITYIGQSIGEYVAATLSGVFSLEDAIKLVIVRGQLMQSMPKGAMLSIQANVTKVAKIIKNHGCEIAVINSPKNCVASGTHESIDNLKVALDKLNLPTIILKVSHGYHSSLMEEAAKRFMLQLKQITLNKPRKRFISNLTGNFITAYEAVNPEYWADHMRKTILFAKGVKTLFNTYNNLFFIEVGVGKSSISFVKQHSVKKYNVVQLLNSQKDNNEKLQAVHFKADILSKLWMGGYNVDFNSCYDYKNGKIIVKLPNYHFDNGLYWINQSQCVNITTSKTDTSAAIFDSTGIKNKVIEQGLSDKYYAIAKSFLDVLGVEKISIYDDFFKLGADSILAVSLATQLQRNYEISIADIFRLRTIAKITEFVPFEKDNFRQKLEQIKLIHAQKIACLTGNNGNMSTKENRYLQKVEHIDFKQEKKKIRGVLLTGSTGHVGCNILYQLLHETAYKIYLLVRAPSSKEADSRVNHKFRYYFDIDLNSYKDRVTVVIADIEKPDLGLTVVQYQELVTNVDSIIHTAAIVKLYGDYNEMYRANVQTTINLLELSRLTKGKDFHYISTIGVLINAGYVPNYSYYVFDEDDDISIFINRNSEYAQTKYEGELVVGKYRKHGVIANIYRLGNVAMHSTNYRHQENIEDNGFFVQTKIILKLKMLYQGLSEVEISPVDCTAAAIVKIFDQVYLSDQTYHVFNPHLCDLVKLFATENGPIIPRSVDEVIDSILKNLNICNLDNEELRLLMLIYQNWLGKIDINNITYVKLLQNKTEAILAKLGFYWPVITKEMCSDIIRRASIIKDKSNE